MYDQSLRGLFALESDPKKREKYVDFIDIYANLSEQKRIQYGQEYLTEESRMTSFKTWLRDQGWQQGMQQGRQQGVADMLLGQLAVTFGQTPSQAVHTHVIQADTDTLRRWSERILSARSAQEVFASGTHPATG